jgi:hypothetical protein
LVASPSLAASNNTWGQYNLVSMALNTLGVQLDAGLEGFARWRR